MITTTYGFLLWVVFLWGSGWGSGCGKVPCGGLAGVSAANLIGSASIRGGPRQQDGDGIIMSIENAKQFLLDLQRNDLAILLAGATYRVVNEDDEVFNFVQPTVHLICSSLCHDALDGLAPPDKQRIVEAIQSSDPELVSIGFGADPLRLEVDRDIPIDLRTELVASLIAQRGVMISVATGGHGIDTVNDYYRARRRRISNLLEQIGENDPNPHEDLWGWFHYYKSELGGYSERRQYCHSLFGQLLDKVLESEMSQVNPREATGWDRVDRGRRKAHRALDMAADEEDFQTVGLICREVLISLAQAVYDAELHHSIDGVTLSRTDAKRMLEAYISATIPGGSNEEIRRHAKASLALAVVLQHRRTATGKFAALCLEATESTVNVIAILSEKINGEN
jgi:hypothetical protein